MKGKAFFKTSDKKDYLRVDVRWEDIQGDTLKATRSSGCSFLDGKVLARGGYVSLWCAQLTGNLSVVTIVQR
jgi:hypothetical protein